MKLGNFFSDATKALIIKANGVIFFLSPVYISVSEVLKSSISVISASSWFVTWGIVVQELTKYVEANFLTLGISLTSISPKSEWENSLIIFFGWTSILSGVLLIVEDMKFFTSSSTILPCLSLPTISLILTPSSRANLRTFGLADETSELSFFIKFCVCITFSIFSSWFWFVTGFASLIVFCSILFSSSPDCSTVNIKSPSETLSPTLILTDLTFPSKEAGISTLDLSLSIVISGSFLDTDWPFETNTSITSTSLNSPIFGTLISLSDIL